jgi:hypothetical protein
MVQEKARQCDLTPRFVVSTVSRLADSLLESITSVKEAVLNQYPGTEHALTETVPLIETQAHRILKQL